MNVACGSTNELDARAADLSRCWPNHLKSQHVQVGSKVAEVTLRDPLWCKKSPILDGSLCDGMSVTGFQYSSQLGQLLS